eukprot:CAMPEP_0206217820 /NCGR_PEP_ID=MMETSP0047_2-20121206/3471_1 /ASSEMBLY_ACC=CAM_ASM_000192 /TAXON_ID=195065 /ORGANISM="Chroomonas mesostigmatica_cf, Strain CCMP1168" /LENGTH=170 /DNA_ID=CAMNT_0053640285 /DNA_START=288 /DNA_END=797 /DNA_ORIENTATION=-
MLVLLFSLPNLTREGLNVVIVPVGIRPGSGSPYIPSHDRRSLTLAGVCTCIGWLRVLPFINSLVMLGQKNFLPTVHGLSRCGTPSPILVCMFKLYLGRRTFLPHAVSNLKIGSTTCSAGSRRGTDPRFASIILTAAAPMERVRSARVASDILTGLSPGFTHADCGRTSLD